MRLGVVIFPQNLSAQADGWPKAWQGGFQSLYSFVVFSFHSARLREIPAVGAIMAAKSH
jgi:hypothetical protein